MQRSHNKVTESGDAIQLQLAESGDTTQLQQIYRARGYITTATNLQGLVKRSRKSTYVSLGIRENKPTCSIMVTQTETLMTTMLTLSFLGTTAADPHKYKVSINLYYYT